MGNIDVRYFDGGMHSDNNPVFQPENSYRSLYNGNFVNLGGNKFAIELSKGNIVSFTLPNNDFIPIGFISFVNFLAVISTNTRPGYTPTINATEIGKVIYNNNGTGTYVPLYHHKDIGHTQAKLIEGHGREENAFIKRGYWTDNNVSPKVFNFADPTFTTYLTSGTLTAGKQYMVIKGTVISGATNYGPGNVAGTVFTATGAETWTAANIVIGYVPVEILDWTPKKNNGTIRFKKWKLGGSVLSGMYAFAYQLEGIGGIRSTWSFVTRQTHVTNSIPVSALSMSYQQYQGAASTTLTNKTVVLNVSDIDQFYTKIRVAVVRYNALNVPLQPQLFFEGQITGTSMDIDYVGGTALSNLISTDLQSIIVGLRTVKTVVSFKNIQFPANLSEYSDVNWTPTANVTVQEYLVPTDIMGYPTPGDGNSLNGHFKVNDTITGNTIVYPRQWYKVYGPAGSSVTYNGVVYGPSSINGDVFQGLTTTYPGTTWTTPVGSPVVVAVLRFSKYGTGAGQVFDYIPIEDDWCDEKGMTVQTHLGSFWRGETVRTGVLFYDPLGNPLFVKWLADKAIDNQYQTQDGINLRLCERYNTANVCLRHIGLNISNLDLNPLVTALQTTYQDSTITLNDLTKFVSGFSIVRAQRSQSILAQGMIFPTTLDGGTKVRPTAALKIGYDKYYNAGGGHQRYQQNYLFHSPEITFGFGNVTPQAGDYLQIVDYYTDNNTTPGYDGEWDFLETLDKHYYLKLYDQTTPVVTASPKGTIDELQTAFGALITCGAINVNFGQPGITFNNDTLVDSAFSTHFTVDTKTIGCTTRLVTLAQTEGAGNFVQGFGEHGNSTIANSQYALKKTLVNWIRPNGVPYGGTSDASKANTLYVYSGHYQKLDTAFMSYLTGNAGIVNNIHVFGGDAFVCIYDLAKGIKNDTDERLGTPFFSEGILFPIESHINLGLREGRHLSRDRSYEFIGGVTYNPGGIDFSTPSGSQVEQFTYNGVYSSVEQTYRYAATPVGWLPNNKFEKRARYSLTKYDGEIIDNFRVFLPNNFQEAEGRNGEINNLIVGINHLFYLQNRGVGYFPVAERETVSTALNQAVQLGIGGIMTRFDNMNTFYGNQHQWGVIRMPDRFAWFDMRNRTMLMMSYGAEGVQEYSIIKGLESELYALFTDIENDPSPNIFDSDQPLLNRGIAGGYDPKYKMGFMTFNFSKNNNGVLEDRSITLGLNKMLDKFIGWYNFTPGIWAHHGGNTLSVPVIINPFAIGYAYEFGEIVSDNFKNYICIVPFTSTNNNERPSLNTANFKQLHKSSEIFVHWRGKTGQFYGKVYDNSLEIVVNKDNYDAKAIDTLEFNGSPVNYDTMQFTSDQGSVSEFTLNSRNYKYFDSNWNFNVPLINRQRFVDNYLIIKGIVKNYSTDPTISLDKEKVLLSVKSIYRMKV